MGLLLHESVTRVLHDPGPPGGGALADGSKGYQMPTGFLFDYVTCANYTSVRWRRRCSACSTGLTGLTHQVDPAVLKARGFNSNSLKGTVLSKPLV